MEFFKDRSPRSRSQEEHRKKGTPYLHHHRSSNDETHRTKVKVILHLKVKIVLVGADGLQEFGDVVGIESACLSGHPAGKVCVADVSNSLSEKAYCHKG